MIPFQTNLILKFSYIRELNYKGCKKSKVIDSYDKHNFGTHRNLYEREGFIVCVLTVRFLFFIILYPVAYHSVLMTPVGVSILSIQ